MTLRIAACLLASIGLAACAGEAQPGDVPTTASSAGIPTAAVSAAPAPADATAPAAVTPTCGGIVTAAGCVMTYDVAPAAAHTTLPTNCADSPTVYNDCSGNPVHLAWTDQGTAQPKAIRVELVTSIFCADPLLDSSLPQHQDVGMNGASFGGFDGDLSACSCAAPAVRQSFDATATTLAAYHFGGDNELAIAGPNRCLGMSPNGDWNGAVARITVTY
jgi:hypothetical protein